MQSLKWERVNAWRLAQHGLSPRLKPKDFLKAVTHTAGIQAQVMSAAEMAIGTRVDGLSPQDVQSALWQDRTIIKTWAMRATLHLVTASELPLYVAARSLSDTRPWVKYFADNGVSKSQYEAYLAAAPEILGSEPMTRDQLATALAEHTGAPELHRMIVSQGWGTPLKILAWRGDLCFGPNDGRNVTFVNTKKWTGGWQPAEPEAALQEMARRYLRAYGPATVEQFAQWWEIRRIPARKLFKSMEDELEQVDVEGRQAVALRETLEPMRNTELGRSVNLLPLFDAYVVGSGRGEDIEPLLPKRFQREVYRPQGWISAAVLVDGYIKGVWEYKSKPSRTLFKVRMFALPPAPVREAIEKEAERIGAFLNTKVEVEFEDR